MFDLNKRLINLLGLNFCFLFGETKQVIVTITNSKAKFYPERAATNRDNGESFYLKNYQKHIYTLPLACNQ